MSSKQFGSLIKYNLVVSQNQTANSKQKKALQKKLNSQSLKRETPIHYEQLNKVAGKDQRKQDISLIVPQKASSLTKYVQLRNTHNSSKLSLNKPGAIISEKMARLLHAKVGDHIKIKNPYNKKVKIRISGITKMYIGHFLLMNKNYYKQAFGKKSFSNANLVSLKDESNRNINQQASDFMDLKAVNQVTQNTSLARQADEVVNSLGKVMIIMIVISVLLTIVILYNLTNINVSERMRELSTIKVLGFYNKEVTMYIYRETIVLSSLGILLGFIFGWALHQYLIKVIPPDDILFTSLPGIFSFVMPALVAALVTIFLGVIVNKRLKNVDMLAALQSVD